MPNLTTKLSLVEDMSEKMAAIADSGHSALDSIEAIGSTADSSLKSAASSADGVASSLSSLTGAADAATAATDNWTTAVGNYDKSALEAIYSTEELVEMGLKSADALSEQEAMFALCEQSAEQLTQSLEASAEIEEQLATAQEEAARMSEALAEADGISAEAKEEYTRAVEEAAEAMENLQAAQEEANAAMENYNSVLDSGTTDLDELEAAAERMGHAAENLSAANERASTATEDLSEATKNAGEELENAGGKGTEAISELENILATAGITAMLKEIAEAAYELADAFSEAEKTIVLATGATGDALEDLESSMMNVYTNAKSADLSSTAGAIGEINTRLGLTGDKLEWATDLFLDYSNVTNQSVVPAVSSVTQLMNQWGVELDGLPTLLDNLTYAGQISGKNVANLTSELVTNKGILQSLGFDLEESIGLFAQFELQGVSTQTAMTGFRTALNNFANDGVRDTRAALQEVVSEIVNAKTESEATAIAVDNFGARAGAALASSIRSGQISIEDLTSALDGAEGALDTTASASQTMGEKLQQAGNSVKSAFTAVLQPAIDKATSAIANMLSGFGTFLKQHPTITKAITAVAIAVGVFTAAIVAYKVATVAATIAQAALNAVMESNPFILVASAVIAATAAIVGFVIAMNEADDASQRLTPTAQKQADEIENLKEEYDRMCDTYGESSYQAQELSWKIEELSAEFENGKQTMAEYIEEHESLVSKWSENATQREEAATSVERESDNIMSLIGRMEELASKTDLTSAEQQELLAIIDKLNEALPGLALSYDKVTGTLSRSKEEIIAIAEAQVNAAKKQTYYENLISALNDKSEAEAQRAEDAQNLADARTALAEATQAYADAEAYAQRKWPGATPNGPEETYRHNYLLDFQRDIDNAQDDVDTFTQAIEDDDAAIQRATTDVGTYADALAEVNTPALEAMETAKSTGEVIDYMADALGELQSAYEEAYNAAYESISGQFGLFDEAKANMESTVASAKEALDSQLEYWTQYTENIQTLTEYESQLTGQAKEAFHELMTYVSDGSPEAAGLAQSMVESIKNGDEEAVTDLASTLSEVQTKQSDAANAVAEWQIDFNSKMDEIVQKAQQTVTNDLNLSGEAAASASATINAYADAITAQGGRAIAAAQSIAAQVKAALSSSTGVGARAYGGVTGYAEGTDYATPGPHLVGENGPEIIEFRGGEKVYNNEETERIMARSAAVQYFAQPDGGAAVQGGGGNGSGGTNGGDTKIIRLEINGTGAIDVNSNTDEATVVAIMQQNLKPVLTSIVRQEIYEEGDSSYDY